MTRSVARLNFRAWCPTNFLALADIAKLYINPQQKQQSAIQRKTLLQQDATITGYQATINIVEIPVGVSEIRHTHPGPLAVYVLEGTLILEHEGRPTTTYKTGDAVLIEAGKVHRGINTGTIPVKLVASLTSEKGKPASSPAP